MSEEATTPDLIALTRRAYEAGGRGDFETVMSDFGPDSVWDMSPMGLVAYEGLAAIRRFVEDWRVTNYPDIDAARAVAERLAESKG